MPTYEYRCKDCGHELEAVQGFHDDPLTVCPACEGHLRKKFGSVGISFKGSGFYKTDSRSGSSTGGSSSEGSATTDSTPAPATSSSDGGSSGSTDGASSDSGSKATAASSSG